MKKHCRSTGTRLIWRFITAAWSFIALLVVAAGCANIVSPTGGPRDTTPPEVIQEIPATGSVNFSGDAFTLRFSEFIQTGNLQQQLLISPPLSTTPEIRLRGKSLTIRLTDSLLPNATYAFFFGDAIKDITEGNSMSPYTYFFSTGPDIDQHTLRGRVFNALDQKVEENILVMLYQLPMADSAVALERPRYVTRADKSGRFEFRHLADTLYHLFALVDLNNNMLYDLATEAVAFRSEPVRPWLEQPVSHDTVPPGVDDTGHGEMTDSLLSPDGDTGQVEVTDSLSVYVVDTRHSVVTDTLPLPDLTRLPLRQVPLPVQPEPVVLRMFTGEDSIQRRLAARSDGLNKAFVVYRYPLNAPHLASSTEGMDTIMIWHSNTRGDTLTIWLRQHGYDALPLIVTDRSGFSDTVSIPLRQPAATARGRARVTTPAFSMNVPRGGKLNPGLIPEITFSLPLAAFDTEASLLITAEDTVALLLEPADTHIPIRYLVANTLERGTEYSIVIPAGACTGWDGTVNDTLRYSFTHDVFENYGTLTVVVTRDEEPSGPVLVMLTDERMNVLTTQTLTVEGQVVFTHLPPGRYLLKGVLDLNDNGRWDSGDYWKGIQPEKVVVIPSPVSLRANWEEEVVWEIRF